MASDTWTTLSNKFEDPDERTDPWVSGANPWVAEVYQGLFMRRLDRM
jgi:hypothetical protein